MPLTVTVPAVPLVPAEKVTASDVVGVTTEGARTPVEEVLQNVSVPHVPVAAPEPVVVPLVSQ